MMRRRERVFGSLPPVSFHAGRMPTTEGAGPRTDDALRGHRSFPRKRRSGPADSQSGSDPTVRIGWNYIAEPMLIQRASTVLSSLAMLMTAKLAPRVRT